ncbi:hypothetical protein BOTBODRAFT_26127 [Botryobasidium botryosum FD-172 SS1]|uniref:ATP synthase subunit delta, mitochondrial n=1 Tax=Botryobasidium botryosum (strain FD-172 SS1) TaxID=930990 RepID=A0A067N1G0_BOTB1|nr:hypothetical protein BOTBODRAFT_26127 [Botryobasidium botryosum FD-172 SS1]
MAAIRSIASARSLSALRRAPVVAFRRGYAEAASNEALKVSLVLPHQPLYNSSDAVQVNISAASGDMGILANHVPSVEPLKAGVIEIIEQSGTKKWFASGGFATVHPNNTLTINAIEAAPLDDFALEAVRQNLAEVQKVLAGNASEHEKVEARVELDVYEALQHALSK